MLYSRNSLKISKICCHLFSAWEAIQPPARQSPNDLAWSLQGLCMHYTWVKECWDWHKIETHLLEDVITAPRWKFLQYFESFCLSILLCMIFSLLGQRAQAVVSGISIGELQNKQMRKAEIYLLSSTLICFPAHFRNNLLNVRHFFFLSQEPSHLRQICQKHLYTSRNRNCR